MECPICFENKDDFYNCDICKETICQDCKKAWEKDCPYCRARYNPPPPMNYVTNIPIIEPSRPLLLDYVHEPVTEPRWSNRYILGAALIGGVFTWFLFQ